MQKITVINYKKNAHLPKYMKITGIVDFRKASITQLRHIFLLASDDFFRS